MIKIVAAAFILAAAFTQEGNRNWLVLGYP